MDAKLETRCKDLAAASLAAYQKEHGGRNPTQENDRATGSRLFEADWTTLRDAGCGQTEQATYRGCWESVFYSLVGAGRG